jgi:molybdate transport repressor ModE-like protein
MRVELRLGGLISLQGRDIALGQTFALLDAIGRERSVQAAAQRLSVSYRSAWGRLLALEEALGHPIVVKTKGHGSVLTELGLALREALGTTFRAFETLLAEEQARLERRLVNLVGADAQPLRLAASHDPCLMSLLTERPDWEIAVMGSQQAVERLLAGRADMAGFHLGPLDPAETPPYEALVQDRAFVVRPLFSRQQGLMVAPGNPLAIGTVADIAATRARFVNRQRGAGTRIWFDQLLAEAGIEPSRIVGYGMEEFTHQAVAAVIASGAADAGMGVRAVAERFGLAFVPIGQETYFLASRAELAEIVVEPLIEDIRGRVGSLPGYAAV